MASRPATSGSTTDKSIVNFASRVTLEREFAARKATRTSLYSTRDCISFIPFLFSSVCTDRKLHRVMRHVRIYSTSIMLKQKQCVVAATKVFASMHEVGNARIWEFFVRKELELEKYFFARNESDRGKGRIV